MPAAAPISAHPTNYAPIRTHPARHDRDAVDVVQHFGIFQRDDRAGGTVPPGFQVARFALELLAILAKRIVEVGEVRFCRIFAPMEPLYNVLDGLSHSVRKSSSCLAAAAMACTRTSSCGSLPGGQGNGKVSKVVVGVIAGGLLAKCLAVRPKVRELLSAEFQKNNHRLVQTPKCPDYIKHLAISRRRFNI